MILHTKGRSSGVGGRCGPSDGTYAEIRRVLNEYAGLAIDAGELADDDDLRAAGMSSHATVDVLVEIEDAFGLEFPPQMLGRRAFASIGTIAAAVAQLQAGSSAA
jgi:acyl carrier protein